MRKRGRKGKKKKKETRNHNFSLVIHCAYRLNALGWSAMTMCIDLSLNLSMGCRPFLHPTTVAWFECEKEGGGRASGVQQTYKLQKRLKPVSWGGRCWPIERKGRQRTMAMFRRAPTEGQPAIISEAFSGRDKSIILKDKHC